MTSRKQRIASHIHEVVLGDVVAVVEDCCDAVVRSVVLKVVAKLSLGAVVCTVVALPS